MQLTDQALVAITLARREAAAHGREPTVADLLVGLAVEPDGEAGHLLRAQATPLALLAERSGNQPGDLAGLDAAIARAADRSRPRPPGSFDLLDAALDVGGDAVADLLVAVGYDVATLRQPRRWEGDELERLLGAWGGSWGAGSETVGLRQQSRDDVLTPGAALAVARVRAMAGGAVELLLALAATADAELAARDDLDPHHLAFVLERLRREGAAAAAGDGWDAGVDVVVDAAVAWRGGERVSAADLLLAAAHVGGVGPRTLLDETELERG